MNEIFFYYTTRFIPIIEGEFMAANGARFFYNLLFYNRKNNAQTLIFSLPSTVVIIVEFEIKIKSIKM
jgi:hypothetical protein